MTGKQTIVTLMKRRGISNAEMSEMLGISQAALWSRLDPRKSDNMTVRTLAEMCGALGYEIVVRPDGADPDGCDLLVGGDDNE